MGAFTLGLGLTAALGSVRVSVKAMNRLAPEAESDTGSSLGGSECVRRGVSAKDAFTLIELSVVILIIGILASLLSTAFNNTKSKGQKVSCLNNLKNLQLAWWFYLDENDNWLALNKSVPGILNQQFFGRPNSSNSWVAGTPKADLTLRRGTLFPYTRADVVYRCPADSSTVLGHEDVLRTRSYSMSAYLAGDEEGIDPRVKSKEAEINDPSPDKIFVFIEENESSSWLGSFRILPRERFTLSAGSWASTPSDRHNQGCNLTFADGHAEYWKWYWPKKVNLQSKLTANGHELRDLWRLQDCVPKQ
jgi:prepilin-type N-terminal cleavage/methylation domain-containing protein/prepilin-type processing-associated H-X9-DG protein